MDRSRVINVIAPRATDTWNPVSHRQLLEVVATEAGRNNLEIVGEDHYLGRGDNRYFGRLKVVPNTAATSTPQDYGFFIGVRNSLDKSYAGSLGFGTEVFVCSNGMFSAEYILNRKHTPAIMEDLPRLTGMVMSRFTDHQANIRHRFDTYKNSHLTTPEAHDLIIRAAEAGATNWRQVPTIVKQWKTPDHPEFADRFNVWRLLNAFTAAAKMGSEADLWDRSLKLQDLLDYEVGFSTSKAEVMTSATEEMVVLG